MKPPQQLLFSTCKPAKPCCPQWLHVNLCAGCRCRVQYGGTLESQTFRFSTADFVYMLLVGIAALLVSAGH